MLALAVLGRALTCNNGPMNNFISRIPRWLQALVVLMLIGVGVLIWQAAPDSEPAVPVVPASTTVPASTEQPATSVPFTVPVDVDAAEGKLPCPHECDGDCDPFSACAVCCHNADQPTDCDICDENGCDAADWCGECPSCQGAEVSSSGAATPPCVPVQWALDDARKWAKQAIADIEALPDSQEQAWKDNHFVDDLQDIIENMDQADADASVVTPNVCGAVQLVKAFYASGFVAQGTAIDNALESLFLGLEATGEPCAQF